MDIGQVITQLRTYTNLEFIEGAADYAYVIETRVNSPKVADAFVIPMDTTASENRSEVGLNQVITETIGIFVRFNTAKNKTLGITGISPVDAMRIQLRSAILNWCPANDINEAYRAIYEGESRIVDNNDALLVWVYLFHLDKWITELDGFPLTSVPLTDIRLTNTTEPDPADQTTFDMPISQS